jgi:hypothetical protein
VLKVYTRLLPVIQQKPWHTKMGTDHNYNLIAVDNRGLSPIIRNQELLMADPGFPVTLDSLLDSPIAQAQRFLSCHGIINNHFRQQRHLLKAKHYRFFRDWAFIQWTHQLILFS